MVQTRPSWAPEGIDITRPSSARVYDYCLGGSHNFAVDRAVAEEAQRIMPNFALILQENRAFLRRAVQFLVSQGIAQFLDIGSGIPTVGNVHEVAQHANPDTRVVYVDIDPIAVAHSQEILVGNTNATIIKGDLREPEQIMTNNDVTRLIDFSQPLGLLIVGVLHFIPDADDPVEIVRRFNNPVVSGSYLAISHASYDQPEGEDMYKLAAKAATPMFFRTKEQIAGLFDETVLIDPGLVNFPLWRPDRPEEVGDHPEQIAGFAGVGHKV